MTKKIKEQIKFYTDLLKDGEFLLLKSKDSYFKTHYSSSPLALLTGFLGTAGEAIIDKTGKITLFVDTRYHILAQKQIYPEIELYKMDLGESFFEAFEKRFQKGKVLYVSNDIYLNEYLKLDKIFDLRTYQLPDNFLKNKDLDEKATIFHLDEKIDKQSFDFKIEKFKKLNPNIEKTVVFNLDEISYLTNLRCFQAKNSSNFQSILYLDLKNSIYVLFCDLIFEKNLKNESFKVDRLDNFINFISSKEGEIFLNVEDINLKNFLAIKKPKELKKNSLALLASIKPKSVIEHLKDCFYKTDCSILGFKNKLKVGLSEFELAAIFENEMCLNGALDLSFKTILALDENSASIHYSSYDKSKILKDESLILLDCGGYYEGGFATDITRVFYFGQKPKPIYKKIYTNVLKAFLACYFSNETNAKELDLMARKILKPFEKEGFYFNHGLGHGIGTSVHQNPPLLSFSSKDIIQPYQTHSIEPGLYGKSKDGEEFGIRIENCVYSDLNYDKISLSKFPFEEKLIDYSILNINETQAIKKWQKDFEML